MSETLKEDQTATSNAFVLRGDNYSSEIGGGLLTVRLTITRLNAVLFDPFDQGKDTWLEHTLFEKRDNSRHRDESQKVRARTQVFLGLLPVGRSLLLASSTSNFSVSKSPGSQANM